MVGADMQALQRGDGGYAPWRARLTHECAALGAPSPRGSACVFYHAGAEDADRSGRAALIHGAGGSYPLTAASRRLPAANVVALDLPGHGESEGPGRSSVAAYAEAVKAAADALGLASTVVAVIRWAGRSLEMAQRYPEYVAGVAVLAGGVRLPVPPGWLRCCAPTLPAPRAHFDGAYTDQTDPRRRAVLLRQLRANSPETLIGDYLACTAFDASSFAPQIAAPALVICGGQDQTVPPELGVALHRLLPHSELHTLEGTGHMLMLERPDPVTQLLGAFAARCITNRFVCQVSVILKRALAS